MDKELWNATEDILMELGIFPRSRTFEYLCEAVGLIAEDKYISDASIYRIIASRCGITESGVRNTCNSALKTIADENMKSVFGNAVPLSVGDFLGALFIMAKRRIK